MSLLTGKNAIVTGGARGIGRSIVRQFIAEGANVAVFDVAFPDDFEAFAAEMRAGGQKLEAFAVDITDSAAADKACEEVQTGFGSIDILVNNAGIGLYGPVKDFAVADFDRVVAVNLRGVFLCCQEAMRMMVPARAGTIINISSVVGFKGYPNQAAYTATKHAVMGLTKTLAVEAQEHGIRTSAILPGGVDTAMVREARPDLDPSILLQPEDVAQTVLFLLSLSDRAAIDEIYIRRRTSTPF
ncbi:MAG: SDR family oxidoreductase [Bacteroidetes bacterium]|nr:SDR family oxidoreductase [Bacteroidota bacterium]